MQLTWTSRKRKPPKVIKRLRRASPLLILACCVCGDPTATRHYDTAKQEGWLFEVPKEKVFDYHRVKSVCPTCVSKGHSLDTNRK